MNQKQKIAQEIKNVVSSLMQRVMEIYHTKIRLRRKTVAPPNLFTRRLFK